MVSKKAPVLNISIKDLDSSKHFDDRSIQYIFHNHHKYIIWNYVTLNFYYKK